jgi:hypothetical protein
VYVAKTLLLKNKWVKLSTPCRRCALANDK